MCIDSALLVAVMEFQVHNLWPVLHHSPLTLPQLFVVTHTLRSLDEKAGAVTHVLPSPDYQSESLAPYGFELLFIIYGL